MSDGTENFPKTMTKGLLKGEWFASKADYLLALRIAQDTGMHNGRRVMTPTKARCAACGEWKHPKNFHKSTKAACGIQSYCKTCVVAADALRAERKSKAKQPQQLTLTPAVRETVDLEVVMPSGTVVRFKNLAREAAVELAAELEVKVRN